VTIDVTVDPPVGVIPDQHRCKTAIASLAPDAGWTDDAALLAIRRHSHTGD
jgi:hypothetical protein